MQGGGAFLHRQSGRHFFTLRIDTGKFYIRQTNQTGVFIRERLRGLQHEHTGQLREAHVGPDQGQPQYPVRLTIGGPMTPSAENRTGASFRTRCAIAVLEILFVCSLLGVWFGSESVRVGKSLWILFFYSFPSMFLIAIVPHEPVLFYFSKFHPAYVVTGVAITGTLLAEWLNYSCFSFFADLRIFEKLKKTKWVRVLIGWFNKAPFLSLWVAGFTPIPFYPFRFLVVLADYPLWKYLSAVFLSRLPRFLIFAYVGRTIRIADSILIIGFLLITIFINVPFLKTLKPSNHVHDNTA
jgi:membrane protein YqaA with SNARE-associated domain